MLILLFRGIFLIGIISWYSTNVWKMIDGYFKERFDKYLQREFQKNPKMRDDVDTLKSSDEESKNSKFSEKDAKKTKTDPLIYREKVPCNTVANYGEEVCTVDQSTMEKMADGGRTGGGSLSSMLPNDHARTSATKAIAKNAVDKSADADNTIDVTVSNVVKEISVNENAVDKTASVKSVQPMKTFGRDRNDNGGSKMTPDDPDLGSKATVANHNDSTIEQSSKIVTKKLPIRRTKLKTRQRVKSTIAEEKENKEKKKKKRVKTIAFTEEDFKKAKIRSGLQDYDFSEFDDEDEESSYEPEEGILVSQLPFKPLADIGNLERVGDDEFCPLTLDNDADCDEIKTWP